jgi:hypothetical protein
MLSEEQNKRFHWKNKLEDLENLPDETFNKEVVWDKLYERLQEKSKKKKFIWYWAAAVLLLMLLVPFFTRHSSKPQLTVAVDSVKNSERIIGSSRINHDINVVKNKDSMSPAEDKAIATENKFNRINRDDMSSRRLVNHIRVSDTVSARLPGETIAKSLQSVDMVPNVAVIMPPKKQLKVVHINELGDPVEELPNVVRNETHSFQLKLGNQEVFVNPAVTSHTPGFTILKSKTSPN